MFSASAFFLVTLEGGGVGVKNSVTSSKSGTKPDFLPKILDPNRCKGLDDLALLASPAAAEELTCGRSDSLMGIDDCSVRPSRDNCGVAGETGSLFMEG